MRETKIFCDHCKSEIVRTCVKHIDIEGYNGMPDKLELCENCYEEFYKFIRKFQVIK